MKLKLLLCTVLLPGWILAAFAQERKVSGLVTQEDSRQPLPGVNIRIKGEDKNTQTSPDGRFSIAVTGQAVTLVFTYTGYEPQEIVATTEDLQVQLKAANNNLNEVVVVAYGTANKSTYTGSASVINATTLERRAVSNISRTLQGEVPGVQSVAPAGQPGSEANIRIRGIGSINASSDPLYVVDGVPFSGNINSINTADVASISVLKDASASALYGSRGANGVIIITTKQGKTNSKPEATLSYNSGVSSRAVKDYAFLNTNQYFELQWEALRNQQLDQGRSAEQAAQYASNEVVSNLKINPFGPSYPNPVGLDGKILQGASPLWNDNWGESLARTGWRQQVDLGINGGSEDSRYFVSGGYLNDKGFIVGSQFRRFNARVNYSTKLNKWFEAGINMAASTSSQDSPPQQDSDQGNYANFARLVSDIYPIYERNPDGSFLFDENGDPIFDFGNYRPSAAATGNNLLGSSILNKYNNKQDILTVRGYLQFNLSDGLKLKSSVNTDYNTSNNHSYTNPLFGSGIINGGSVNKSSSRRVGYTINNLLDYTFDVANAHHFNILGGQEIYVLNISRLGGSRSNFGFAGKEEPDAASLLNSFTGDADNYKLSSFLGKIDYNFNQRYYFSASFRRDGSSRFSPDSRWGNFWSVGASWNAKAEKFLQHTDWLNSLTLRSSYGAQGNDNLGSYYAYQDLYSIYNSLGQAGLITSRLPTPGLKWETNLNFNAGIDFALLDNRISGTFEVYQRQSRDLLFSRPLAPSLGYTAIDANIGSLRNKGLEGQINFVPVLNEDFRWSVSFNLGHYNNKITKLPQEEIITGNIGQLGSTKKLTVGSSVYDFFIREWAGVDPQNGKPLWYKNTYETDAGGQRIETGRTTTSVYADADQYFAGSALPDLYGGVNTAIRYKDFELYALLSYSIGGKTLDLDQVMIMHTGENTGRTWGAEILNRWTPENTQTDVPRLSTTTTNWNSISTRFLYDATYARLKNVSLTYSLPAAWSSAIGFKRIRAYVRGENLLTFYGHDGMDPEQAVDGVTYYRYPAQKTYTFGFDISF